MDPSTSQATTDQAESRRLRVLSWNLGYHTPGSFKARTNRRRQWALLLALDPDIALLQECRPEDLADFGPEWAMDEYSVLAAPASDRWQAASAIVARSTFSPTLVTPSEPWFDYLWPYVVRGTVIVDGVGTVNVASVHADASKVDDPALTDADHALMRQPGSDRTWHCDMAAWALRDWVADSFVVAGDWNTARQFTANYSGTSPDAPAFFSALRSWGWDESMRQKHPNEVQTFFRAGNAAYQLDHLFTDASLADGLASCEVVDDPLVRELSDHAPIVADFQVSAAVE